MIVKKAISIIFALCVLFSGVHLTVSNHYCGGMLVDQAVSVTGKIASCGMEECEDSCPVQGDHLSSSCCQDLVYIYSVDNHFTPSTSFFTESYNYNGKILDVAARTADHFETDVTPPYKNEYPPGALLSTRVDLSCICVFRI